MTFTNTHNEIYSFTYVNFDILFAYRLGGAARQRRRVARNRADCVICVLCGHMLIHLPSAVWRPISSEYSPSPVLLNAFTRALYIELKCNPSTVHIVSFPQYTSCRNKKTGKKCIYSAGKCNLRTCINVFF